MHRAGPVRRRGARGRLVPPSMSSRWNRVATSGRWLAFLLAVLLLAGAGLLLVVEQTGLLRRRVESELAARLGDLGQDLSIESVELRWFALALELRGLSIGPGGETLRLRRVALAAGLRGGRPGLRRVDVEEGHLRFGDGLLTALRELSLAEDDPEEEDEAPVPLPDVTVRAVQLDLAHREWGEIPIGRVDLRLRGDAGEGQPELEGRLLPTLAASDAARPEIYLLGRRIDHDQFDVEASAENLPVALESLPSGTALERLRAFAPQGFLTLEAGAHVHLSAGAEVPYRGRVRASLTRASFVPPTTDLPAENLRAEVELELEPRAGADAWDPDSWTGLARFEGTWNGTPIEGAGRLGRAADPGDVFAGWARAERLPLSEATLRATGFQDSQRRTWDALGGEGFVELLIGVALPDRSLPGNADRPLELTADVVGQGELTMAYFGWPEGPDLPRGFPMPVDAIEGRCLSLVSPGHPVQTHMGILDGRGFGRLGGEAEIDGLIAWLEPGEGQPALDLSIRARDVPMRAEVLEALDGYWRARWVRPTFDPRHGEADVEARFVKTTGYGPTAARLDIEFEGVDARWNTLPVDVRAATGRIELTVEGGAGTAVAFRADGELATADSIEVAGRLQDDPALQDRSGVARRTEALEVVVRNVSLRGADRDTLVETWPVVGAALDAVQPAGKVDVRVKGRRPRPGAAFDWNAEVAPREVRVTPAAFAIPVQDVRGRVLVEGSLGGADAEGESAEAGNRVVTRVAPLLGEWAGDVSIAARGQLRAPRAPGEEDVLTIRGAGIDPSNKNFVAVLAGALAGTRSSATLDLSNLEIGGRVDAGMDVAFADAAAPRLATRIHLRDNDLTVRSNESAGREVFRLDRLRGVLERSEGEVRGPRITAELGSTPVELLEPRLRSVGGGFELVTGFEGLVPIDREHLGYFLDDEMVELLIDRVGWGGSLEARGTRLRLSGSPGGRPRIEIDGEVLPVNMVARLGLPISIGSASVQLQRFVVEGGQVQSWARVEGLYGQVAGRELSNASMTLGYVQPRLSILSLDGELEGGRVSDERSDDTRVAAPLHVDLMPPFPFTLALQLDEVEVEGLLRDVVESNLANEGTLSGVVRLAGDLENIGEVYGSGWADIDDARLWSIPVVRDLLSLFGLDGSAVFEAIRTSLRLRGGVVELREFQARSPILQLVGQGSVDLDGTLAFELRPRFSIVENLGFLARVGRKLQDSLLTLEVGGDLARPRVRRRVLLLNRLVQEAPRPRKADKKDRDLPVPAYTPLPERF